MMSTIKRLVAGLAIAAVLGAGLVATPQDASAKTRVFRSDDGKLMIVCLYDDETGELAYCDVYWLGDDAEAEIVDDGGATGGTRVPRGEIAFAGGAMVLDGGAIDGAPDKPLVVEADDEEPTKARKGKKGKRGGKGGRR